MQIYFFRFSDSKLKLFNIINKMGQASAKVFIIEHYGYIVIGHFVCMCDMLYYLCMHCISEQLYKHKNDNYIQIHQ